jgi:hypothetical protein
MSYGAHLPIRRSIFFGHEVTTPDLDRSVGISPVRRTHERGPVPRPLGFWPKERP